MSPRPRKEEQQNLQQAIIHTAWQQIAQLGAPALTLRGIARELGITAPAIYNYFPDRDALVTALIIEAYTSFGDAQLAARDSVPAQDLKGRLHAIGTAYRAWALAYPQRYELIFGTPIPGYQSPPEKIFPVGARALSALVSVIEQLRRADKLAIRPDDVPQVQPAYLPLMEQWQQFNDNAASISISLATLIWARVHGLVSLEIGGGIPPFGLDGDALYQYELQSIAKQFILA